MLGQIQLLLYLLLGQDELCFPKEAKCVLMYNGAQSLAYLERNICFPEELCNHLQQFFYDVCCKEKGRCFTWQRLAS